MKKNEVGRSMIEMLAVLAIIGVLSIGGIAGYTIAADRIRHSNILDIASKLSAKGVGGKEYPNLASAGLTGRYGVEMGLSRNGIVCISFNRSNAQEERFFQSFRSYAISYRQDNVTRVTIQNAEQTCDVALLFSQNPR